MSLLSLDDNLDDVDARGHHIVPNADFPDIDVGKRMEGQHPIHMGILHNLSLEKLGGPSQLLLRVLEKELDAARELIP